MNKSTVAITDILAARAIQLLEDAKTQNGLNEQLMLIVCDKITGHYQRAAVTSLYEVQTMLVEKINKMEEAANGNTDNPDKLNPGNDDSAGEHQPV